MNVPKQNIPYYLIALGIFILFKFGYQNASTDDLILLLKPTDQMVSLLTGSASVYTSDFGFHHPELNILIEKSCSGFNFLLLCFLMLTFLILNYAQCNLHRQLTIPVAFIAAYFLTIFVNTSRIFVSVIVKGGNIDFVALKPDLVHTAVGIVINLSFLILIYFLTEKLLRKLKKDAQPA